MAMLTCSLLVGLILKKLLHTGNSLKVQWPGDSVSGHIYSKGPKYSTENTEFKHLIANHKSLILHNT